MATGGNRIREQAKPAKMRPQKHRIESRQMDQHRRTEDSSSESLTSKDSLFSVCWLTMNELRSAAGRSRRRTGSASALVSCLDSHRNQPKRMPVSLNHNLSNGALQADEAFESRLEVWRTGSRLSICCPKQKKVRTYLGRTDVDSDGSIHPF